MRALLAPGRRIGEISPFTRRPIAAPGKPEPMFHTNESHVPHIDPFYYTATVKKLREFFDKRGFLEVHTQNRLSILAACEDPSNLATYNYSGRVWPMPQTGQMWLEYEMLMNPHCAGLYCVSTSFRNEPNPVVGRHDLIFPMFEFELHGGMDELIKMEKELCEFLGFGAKDSFKEGDFLEVAKKYQVADLTHEHERRICAENGPVYFLKNFPEFTSPFWNMSRHTTGPHAGLAKKCDVLIHGVETIGSAERSCDKDEMERRFLTISEGQYAKLLYSQFTRDRVLKELKDFLSLDFFPRSGGGIGLTRMMNGLRLSGLLPQSSRQ